MSSGFTFSNIFQYLEYLPYIDKFVAIAHDATDSDSTKDKAADVVEDLLDVAAPLIEAKNPALAVELNAAIALIKGQLDGWKDKPPVLAPAPPPPPVDPTSVEYETKDEAIAHITPTNSTVWQRGDRKFSVWPKEFPGPGTQVYP